MKFVFPFICSYLKLSTCTKHDGLASCSSENSPKKQEKMIITTVSNLQNREQRFTTAPKQHLLHTYIFNRWQLSFSFFYLSSKLLHTEDPQESQYSKTKVQLNLSTMSDTSDRKDAGNDSLTQENYPMHSTKHEITTPYETTSRARFEQVCNELGLTPLNMERVQPGLACSWHTPHEYTSIEAVWSSIGEKPKKLPDYTNGVDDDLNPNWRHPFDDSEVMIAGNHAFQQLIIESEFMQAGDTPQFVEDPHPQLGGRVVSYYEDSAGLMLPPPMIPMTDPLEEPEWLAPGNSPKLLVRAFHNGEYMIVNHHDKDQILASPEAPVKDLLDVDPDDNYEA